MAEVPSAYCMHLTTPLVSSRLLRVLFFEAGFQKLHPGVVVQGPHATTPGTRVPTTPHCASASGPSVKTRPPQSDCAYCPVKNSVMSGATAAEPGKLLTPDAARVSRRVLECW
jgi:hypothetical protein